MPPTHPQCTPQPSGFLVIQSFVTVSDVSAWVGFPGGADGKEPACSAEDLQEDPLEKGMAIHSSVHAGRIPWMDEPGGLHSP